MPGSRGEEKNTGEVPQEDCQMDSRLPRVGSELMFYNMCILVS